MSPANFNSAASSQSPLPEIPDYELLRVIGCGSYGEVWLARNVLGELRAVKVIYRRAFDHDRPYEREVEGIRKFEPVSRSHPSQLNVLHVGRNDAAGYFYYVMELADDASALDARFATSSIKHPVSSTSDQRYTPRTLKTDLDRHGRLPAEECLRIGLALTTALEHLHSNGLVHRDVKPSNIIFVHGVPKLADIGLVASVDATMSFVGTSGFLPPEGPGTPQADLYSLGKVLYEASTGRDRQEFPKLPADLDEWNDAARLVELNAVILKACAQDPSARYRSAQEMAADLVLLQRGQSVRRLRIVERRLALFTRIGAAALALLVLAAALYWGARRQARATARQLYVADMSRAMQAWEGGNVTLARELLETHRQLQPEMIGFEWRLLTRLCEQSDARLTLHGHGQTVWSVAFSPNGRWLATGSGDRTIKLWQPASGSQAATLLGHSGSVHALAFSPDGKRLASGSRDFTVKLWDTESWNEVATLRGHTNAVRAVGFSPSGEFLVSAGEDKTIRWWSLATTQQIATLPSGFTIEQLGFAPDGSEIAACGADAKVHFWDCATREELPAVQLHQVHLLDLAYSTDGRILATSSYDGTIKLWDTAVRKELATLGRGAPVYRVTFASGDKFLAAASEDGLIRLWDVVHHEILTTLRGHDANVRALAFSPQGDALASGDEAGIVKLWEIPAAPGRENALIHQGMANALAFSPDGRTVATTDPKVDTLRLWDARSQRELAAIQSDKDAIWRVAFDPGGTALATGGVDGSVRLWNPTNLMPLMILKRHHGGIDAITFSPDGRLIASGSRDLTVRLWEKNSGKEHAMFATSNSVVRAVSFSPDGRTLVSGSMDGLLRFWNLRSLREDFSLTTHHGEIRGLVFSPDGRTLVSGGADRTIRVWDVARQRLAQTLAGHSAMISSLAFSPDGKTLTSGSWDSTVKLWNLRLFREVATLRAHSSQVTQVAFASDGNILASSSSDGTVRLWRADPVNVEDGRNAVRR